VELFDSGRAGSCGFHSGPVSYFFSSATSSTALSIRHPDQFLIPKIFKNAAQCLSAIGRPDHKGGWMPIVTMVASRSGWASGGVELVKISCASGSAATRSLRNGYVRALNKSRTCVCRDLRFRGACLDAGAKCFPATSPAHPRGWESLGSHLCGYPGCERQL
jgi:hypothetical protein